MRERRGQRFTPSARRRHGGLERGVRNEHGVEAGRGAVRGMRSDETGDFDEARFWKVRCRLRRPEGRQCVEGRAERDAGRRMVRNETTRNTLPVRRPPKHFLTNGKLGSCRNEGWDGSRIALPDCQQNLKNTESAGVGVAPKINHR